MLSTGSYDVLAGKPDWAWGRGEVPHGKRGGSCSDCHYPGGGLLHTLEYMIRATFQICRSVIQKTFPVRF